MGMALPPEIMGRIAAFADTRTRRAMVRGRVVALEDVLYHLPPESLSYTEITEHAMEFNLPNKYDSYLRSVALSMRTHIADQDKGLLRQCKDKVYAAMAYYLLTDSKRGLKISDIKGLAIRVVTIIGPRLKLYNSLDDDKSQSVDICHREGDISIYFLTDGNKEHRDDGPSNLMYSWDGRTIIMFQKDGMIHRYGRPAVIRYGRTGRLEHEVFWVHGTPMHTRDYTKPCDLSIRDILY